MSPESSRRHGNIVGLDHASLPMQNTEAMLAFYRSLGLDIAENPYAASVYVGNQMINLHRPATWQREDVTLRAPAAEPPCGDLCFVWDGSPESLNALLDNAGAEIIEGPVERQGGRRADASSVYVRDPDGNLLEFMIYPTTSSDRREGEASDSGASTLRRSERGPSLPRVE
jgi:catechol 2,3-dioxygenase-like lactoylglutathione lyase family enzyme